MSVAAPPRPPAQPGSDPLQALIEEARRRARRRRLLYAVGGLAAAATAVGVLVAATKGGGAGTAHRGSPAAGVATRRLPANGLLAVLGQNGLDVVQPDGSGRRLLTRCVSTTAMCAFAWYGWSPDGRRLAFVSGREGGANTDGDLSLYVIDADGTGRRKLAGCRNCGMFQGATHMWSPDGRRIALVTDRQLELVDVATGQVTKLRTSTAHPAWSPDGSRIAFGSGKVLATIAPNGSARRILATLPAPVYDVSWSPDGRTFAFDTGDQLYVVGARGQHLVRLVDGARGSGPGTPAWSPDGRRIVYFYTPGTPGHFGAEVWLTNPDGMGRKRIYRSCCVGQWVPPVWSPDSREIAIGGDDSQFILIVDPSGHLLHRLLGRGADIAWQPVPRHG